MSDPMTNFDEKEDILASIRRLVADSYVPTSAPRPSALQDVSPFRAPTVSDAPVDESDADAPTDAPDIETPLLVLSAENLIAEPAEAPRGEEPHVGAPHVEAASAPFVLELEWAVSVPTAEAETPETPWHAALDDTPAPQAADHVAGLTLEQRIAELEQAIGAVAEDWEPDGSTDLDAEIPREVPRAFTEAAAKFHAKTDTETDASEASPAPVSEATQADTARDTVTDTVADTVPDNVHVLGTFGSRVIAGGDAGGEDDMAPVFEEAELAHLDGDSPAPASDTEAQSETAQAETAQAEAQQPNEAQTDTESDFAPAGFDMDGDHFAFDDMADDPTEAAPTDPAIPQAEYIDEGVLREMVADVLGEELRGALGERMTRNIRRLVRREVQRAMAMRDLQ